MAAETGDQERVCRASQSGRTTASSAKQGAKTSPDSSTSTTYYIYYILDITLVRKVLETVVGSHLHGADVKRRAVLHHGACLCRWKWGNQATPSPCVGSCRGSYEAAHPQQKPNPGGREEWHYDLKAWAAFGLSDIGFWVCS